MIPSIRKYPRTRHLEGSGVQPDDIKETVPFSEIVGLRLVVEEKLDGANCGISFGPGRELLLQSRGHYLSGGAREKQFELLKAWASAKRQDLWEVLGGRLVMYGEWLLARHAVYYDRLPHYFMEFDILDLSTGLFLSTEARRGILEGTPICSVPVLSEGALGSMGELKALIGPSLFKSREWREAFRQECEAVGLDPDRQSDGLQDDEFMEGLYVKAEHGKTVAGRWKLVRKQFLDAVTDARGHWMSRPIVPNRLAPGADLFA